jgi:hypothetical protein
MALSLCDKVNPIESWRKKNPLNDKGLSFLVEAAGIEFSL